MGRGTLLRFFGVLLLVSWLVQCAAIYLVRDLNLPRAAPWLIASMFIPTSVALIYRFGFNRRAFQHVDFRPGNLLYWLLAALIPAGSALTVLAIVQVTGWGYCDFFSFGDGGAQLYKGPWVLGLGAQSWPMFAANIAVTAVAFSLMNGVAAVGEEFAWRGFLQKPMIHNFGLLGGIALLGLIWGYWHLPANLAGYNHPHAPVLGGVVLFPVLLVAESFIMAWLTLRAGSFWPAVLMHGSINGIQEGILSHIVLAEGVSRLRIDLAAMSVAGVMAAFCAWSLIRRPFSASTRPGKDFLIRP